MWWPFKSDPLVRGKVAKKNYYHPDPEAIVEIPMAVGGRVVNQAVRLTTRGETDTWELEIIDGVTRSGKTGQKGSVIVSEWDYNSLNEGDTWICAKSPNP